MNGPQRILLVDDDVDATEVLSELLQDWGHVVCVVNESRAVLERARVFQPEVVLLDVELPHVSGYEVARMLRATPELSSARLVALTGYGRTEDRIRAREAGFDSHWLKPLEPSRLETLLQEL